MNTFSLPGSTSGVEGSEHSPGWLLDELSEYYSTWLPQEQVIDPQKTETSLDFLNFNYICVVLNAIFVQLGMLYLYKLKCYICTV